MPGLRTPAPMKVSNDMFRKTRLCKFYAEGRCGLGDTCNFAHGQGDLRRQPDLYRTRLCTDFVLTGACGAGSSCTFAHGASELRGNGVDEDKPSAVESSSGQLSGETPNVLKILRMQVQLLQAHIDSLAADVVQDPLGKLGQIQVPAASCGWLVSPQRAADFSRRTSCDSDVPTVARTASAASEWNGQATRSGSASPRSSERSCGRRQPASQLDRLSAILGAPVVARGPFLEVRIAEEGWAPHRRARSIDARTSRITSTGSVPGAGF